MTTRDYSPWGDLGENWPDWRCDYRHDLPGDLCGYINLRTKTVYLDRRLRPIQRRCVLGHEIYHMETGGNLYLPGTLAHLREERRADTVSARRLITMDKLAKAAEHCRDRYQLADELRVDQHTLAAFMASLTPAEREVFNIERSA